MRRKPSLSSLPQGFTSMSGFKLKSVSSEPQLTVRSSKPSSAKVLPPLTRLKSSQRPVHRKSASTSRPLPRRVTCFKQGIRDIIELTRENLPSKGTEASEAGVPDSRYTIPKNIIVSSYSLFSSK